LTVAAGALAKDGLLVTRGHAIETLARATHFVFDKTGTLTTGRMHLQGVQPLAGLSADRCLALAAALELTSEHPLAAAMRAAAAGLAIPPAATPRSEPGQGVEAWVDKRRYRLGRPDFALDGLAAGLPADAAEWLAGGDTVVALADDTEALALFRLGDEVRPEASSLIAMLKAAGKQVTLLTGDALGVARRIAADLQIVDVRAGVTPQGKHDVVRDLQRRGAVVAMIGDGVNDAPVLAQAQVSVAMGGGAQLARTQADLILLSENLDHLRDGLRRSILALRIIKQNLWWSFAYNFIALPLAVTGHVTPWLAGIGMSASSLLVVLNSLRIQRTKEH